MSASDFNKEQFQKGLLSEEMLTELVECWQRNHGLTVDGYAGPVTQHSLASSINQQLEKYYPLPVLADGRRPVITSGFYTENPSRPKHRGVDFFYHWLDSDPDVPTGDGGAIKVNGKRRWWYPPGATALAAAQGKVIIAGKISTGWRCWIDHGNGERTGYFHGDALLVKEDDIVAAGQEILLIGDSPIGHDGKHLHFEVSPVGVYAPKNPRKWLEGARYSR